MNMAEANDDVNNQRKRRLPQWMSPSGSSSKEKQIEEDADGRSQPHSFQTSDTVTSEEFIVKERDLETKEKSRTSNRNTLDASIGCSKKSSLLGRPPKANSKKMSKTKKTTRTHERKDGNEDLGDVTSDGKEGERELTIDDLISIARQYVKGDEEAKRVGKGVQESSSRTVNSGLSSLARSSDRACDPGEASESTTASRGSQTKPKIIRNSSDHLELGNATTTSSRFNDAAQDMLDLFLGPLLNKPNPGGRQAETIAVDDTIWASADTTRKHTVCQTSDFLDPLITKPDLSDWKSEVAATDDMIWASVTTSMHMETTSEAGRSEVVVVKKKKSSLKDKVTMLLD